MLSEEDVWRSPNEAMNSVGNLVLHLNGNVHQWINATLGNQPDNRRREEEFSKARRATKSQLVEQMDEMEKTTRGTIMSLTEESLTHTYEVQCYEENGLSILVHVMEHFSYHVGQITLLTKLYTEKDTAYYAGQDLGRTR